MAQNHAHNPSAFRQAYQDNSVFHHSLSSMGYSHPQYKTGASRRNFPLSDVNISGYGGFGSAANFPGAILQAAASAGSAGGHDFLLSQHQERNDFTTLHQNDGSSRMMFTLPDNGYFSLPGLFSGHPKGQQQQSQD
uniref:Uncharacterized protein n=1 Tax=Populus trichocarpa TaxID=3694 RepID=A0A3N7F574_POPTR